MHHIYSIDKKILNEPTLNAKKIINYQLKNRSSHQYRGLQNPYCFLETETETRVRDLRPRLQMETETETYISRLRPRLSPRLRPGLKQLRPRLRLETETETPIL